jgi:hypothetical protein
MILDSQDAVSIDSFVATVSTDFNIAPSNLGVICGLSGMFFTGTSGSAFSGISGFTTQDPTSGVPTQTDLSSSFFNSSAVVVVNNAITITFVTGALAAGSSGWPVSVDNLLYASGFCQVTFS